MATRDQSKSWPEYHSRIMVLFNWMEGKTNGLSMVKHKSSLRYIHINYANSQNLYNKIN